MMVAPSKSRTWRTALDRHDSHDLEQIQQTFGGYVEGIVCVQQIHVHFDFLGTHVQMRWRRVVCN